VEPFGESVVKTILDTAMCKKVSITVREV